MTERMRRQLEIVNEKGLHARAAAKFVEVVEGFDAQVEVSQRPRDRVGRQHHGAFDVGSGQGKHY